MRSWPTLRQLWISYCLSFPIAHARAQPATSQKAVNKVTVPVGLLKKHVYLLASDSLQGRGTGQQGQRDAALHHNAIVDQNTQGDNEANDTQLVDAEAKGTQ